jgi:hypothetical protein
LLASLDSRREGSTALGADAFGIRSLNYQILKQYGKETASHGIAIIIALCNTPAKEALSQTVITDADFDSYSVFVNHHNVFNLGNIQE